MCAEQKSSAQTMKSSQALCGPSVSIIWILKFTIPKRARATRRAGLAGWGGTRCGRYRIRAQSSPPRCRPRGRGRASVDVRCPDPAFAHAHPQILLVLIDEIALLAARADDLDDDVRHPFRPDLVAGWLRVEVDGLVRVPVRHHARKPHAAFGAARTIIDATRVLFVIMNEHPSQPIDYATVPGAWNFRHFNDSSRQLVHPTLLEFGLD